jgi:MFS family permease
VENTEIKVYKYRWVMLSVFMLITIVNQLLWITFAAITSASTVYYGVDNIQIGMLSMCFMIVFIFVSIPASWIIDKYGIKIGVGIGAVLTGVFGMMRSLVGNNYEWLLVMQIGIAVGQPFLLNAITKLVARWFPLSERATGAGLATLSMYLGPLAGMLLTPYLVTEQGFQGMLYTYGILSIGAALIFLLFSKEKPHTPPCLAYQEERSLVYDGLKDTLRNKNFLWLFVIFFIGLGIFNSVTTWIEDIVEPRGFTSEDAGLTGGLMIIGGIFGALVMPYFSDRIQKRKLFIVVALVGATIGLAGITFAHSYWMLMLSAFTLGYFLLSAGPIGFQYGAEITYPASEGTSNGLMILAGQISGIGFIYGMEYMKDTATGSMTKPLSIMIALSAISIFLTAFLRESPFMKKNS